MRRADRLFQIVNLLRSRRRVITAAEIARKLEVSERTVYRDIAALIGTGVPIDGEAGVGYRIDRAYDLPPIMFSAAELQALRLGARWVQLRADAELARAAGQALTRIECMLPPQLRNEALPESLHVIGYRTQQQFTLHLPALRQAIEAGHCVSISYRRADGEPSHRTIEPLGLFFWSYQWTVGAWCHHRQDFRSFRIDRIETLEPRPDCLVTHTLQQLCDSIPPAEIEAGAEGEWIGAKHALPRTTLRENT